MAQKLLLEKEKGVLLRLNAQKELLLMKKKNKDGKGGKGLKQGKLSKNLRTNTQLDNDNAPLLEGTGHPDSGLLSGLMSPG